MTWANGEQLYDLLPAVYRQRDHARGESLRALLSILQSEVETLEADIEGLYDNWFVETAAEWLIPYLGDLLGVRNLHTVDSAGIYSLRAYVANTLRYRQRKGTAAVLEQLANDVTNWEARVVEFFQLLGTTQHLNHVRLFSHRTPNLRDSNTLELLDSPFDTIAHTGEVRRIATRQGRYNIPNIGLFLWRLQPYSMQLSAPGQVGVGRFTFHPVGLDAPLFNNPQSEPEIAHVAAEINVPGPLRRRVLYEEMTTYRNALTSVADEVPKSVYFHDNLVFSVVVSVGDEDERNPLTPEETIICNLADWEAPESQPFTRAHNGETYNTQVAVDPVLGRLMILPNIPDPAPNTIREVSYTYGFSSDVGGGPYNRNDSLPYRDVNPATQWVGRVDQEGGPNIFTTLIDAVAAWNAQPPGTQGVIAITDSHTYQEELTGTDAILIPAGSELMIVATQSFDPTITTRLDARSMRPHLDGNLTVDGTAPANHENPGELILNGLLIEGTVRLREGNLGRLTVHHCTLAPRPNSLLAPSQSNSRLHVTLDHAICGRIELEDTVPRLTIVDSLIDNAAGEDILAPGADVQISRSTVLGADDALSMPAIRTLHASESIFTGRLVVERRQVGCARFCHIPPDSRTPRRYRCQPDLALDGLTDAVARRATTTRLRPQFTSTDYGEPGYGQLSQQCALEIRTGAEDGSEMGVFSHLKQPQREANLRVALEEYLPFGLQAGMFYVT
jgi:phage tail-like protein